MESHLPAGFWHRRDTEGDEVKPVTWRFLILNYRPIGRLDLGLMLVYVTRRLHKLAPFLRSWAGIMSEIGILRQMSHKLNNRISTSDH
jgi:hypothetical protein